MNEIASAVGVHLLVTLNQIGKPLVTQDMVAAAAKVHRSTVSLALRNDPRLPKGTRRRLQSVARRLGYTTNPLVSMLMSRVRLSSTSYRGTLAYLHTVPKGTPYLDGWVHRNYLAGAKRRSEELGYVLDEFHLDGDRLNGRRLTAMLRARNIAGVVVEHVPSPNCPDRTLQFDVGPFASSSLGVPLARPHLHYVANDQYMRAILAARELLALGYRRLGLLVVDVFDSAMAHRCSAGFWAVQRYVKGLAALPICQIRECERERFQRWLIRHEPDVILANSNSLLPVLEKAGLRVPEDLGWVVLDWQPEYKPAAGVHGNSERSGAAAVELVVSQIHRGESGPPVQAMSYLVEGSWVPGKTIRPMGPALELEASFFADLPRP